MNGDSRPVVQQAGLEAGFKKRQIHAGRSRPNIVLVRSRLIDPFADCEGKLDVGLYVGLGAPEKVVRLVVHLPDDASSFEVGDCSSRPTRERLYPLLRVEREPFIVQGIGVTEDE